MTRARALLFSLAFVPLTFLMALAGLPLFLASKRWTDAYGRAWARACMWLLKRIVGLDWEVRGRPPAGAALIAAKHQSAWETLALTLVLDRPSYVIKRALLFTPPFGPYLWRAGMIAIDRGAGARALRQVQAGAVAVLADERPLVIFPEGTRRAPHAPPAYQRGVAALYRGLDAPVTPVALNSGLFWRRNAFLKRPGRITIEFLEPIPPGLSSAEFMRLLEDRIETATNALVEEAEQAFGIVD